MRKVPWLGYAHPTQALSWVSMRRIGEDSAVRKGRSTSRSVASLLVVWLTMVAIVIYQMPAFAWAVQAMPVAASAVMSNVSAPCDVMGPTADENWTGTTAMLDAGMPCCKTSSSDAGMGGDHACPLMGGCFSMCVSIVPPVTSVQMIERVAERLGFVDDAGVHFSVPPLQRPPKLL